MVKQYEVYWVDLNPTQGGEMSKMRPCVVVSPNSLNDHLKTIIIAPITSTIKNVAFRVQCYIGGRLGEIAADQIRAIDKRRIKGKLTSLSNAEISNLQEVFRQMLCE